MFAYLKLEEPASAAKTINPNSDEYKNRKDDVITGIWSKSKGFKKIESREEINISAPLGLDNHGRVLIESGSMSKPKYYLYDDGKFTLLEYLNFNTPIYYLMMTKNNWIFGALRDEEKNITKPFAIKMPG